MNEIVKILRKALVAVNIERKTSLNVDVLRKLSIITSFDMPVLIDQSPVLQSLILISPDTVRITYDKVLNEAIIPALGDYIFQWSAETPVFVSAEVGLIVNEAIDILFNNALAPSGNPEDFIINASGGAVTCTGLGMLEGYLTLRVFISRNITQGETVSVQYVKGVDPLIGENGGEVAEFTEDVTNNVYNLVDLDGNVYTEVTIGSQVWIVENLKVTKYADGSAIPNITDNATWAADTEGAMCFYDNDIANKAIYGGLYSGHAVMNVKGLAKLTKNGVDQLYRVSTDADWTALSDELGGNTVAGGKLKEAGLAHWLTPNTGATNESGFTALPGGFRTSDGEFGDILSVGIFWCSDVLETNFAIRKRLFYNKNSLNLAQALKNYGNSIRLVKDLV